MDAKHWNSISHQLANSIAVIRTNAEILNSSISCTERDKRVINRILQCSNSTAHYLNDLHLINSLQTDSYTEKMEDVCVVELFDSYPDVILTLPPKMHPFLGYKDLFRRIVKELMDNAIKYSVPNKEIEARIECQQFYSKISIYNYANPKHQLKVNDIIEIGERGYNSSYTPGNGMGLPIVSAIIRYLKGDLLLDHDYRGRFIVSALIPKG